MLYPSSAERYTQFIKEKALALGFDFCGVARAEFLENEAPRLEQWLQLQRHGQMSYMANHFDKRLDPRLLVEDSKSVVSLLFNYFPEQDLAQNDNYKISKYAYGTDYHFVIRDKLNELLELIREEIGEVGGRSFVDSAPVMDKAWAQRSGLGWIGKNSNLINKQSGSFFFIAELIIDLELVPDAPIKDYCGTCRKCIDACPTEAIVAPYVVDGSRCISYFTIELKENIPPQMQGKFDDWVFGCDVCQDVCPWNRFSKPHTTPAFAPHQDLAHLTKKDWHELTSETFGKVFGKSALKRTKLSGIQRNVRFISGAVNEE